jgi:hypothetical protein
MIATLATAGSGIISIFAQDVEVKDGGDIYIDGRKLTRTRKGWLMADESQWPELSASHLGADRVWYRVAFC